MFSKILKHQIYRLHHGTLQCLHVRYFTSTPEMINYFSLLGQPETFTISDSELKQSYQSQMKLLHPDKHTLKSEPERQEFVEKSTNVVRAYEVLKDDYRRALHLLELNGESLEEEGVSVSGNIVGMEILMLVMEVREMVDAILEKDKRSDEEKQKLQLLLEENNQRTSDTIMALMDAFESKDLAQAKRLVATLQYWNKINETIIDKI